jgi:hypothetical protein
MPQTTRKNPNRSKPNGVIYVRGARKLSPEQREKNDAALQFLRSLMADETGWQERNWAIAKRAIERNRSVYRKRFSD